jgi:hypothetical protein
VTGLKEKPSQRIWQGSEMKKITGIVVACIIGIIVLLIIAMSLSSTSPPLLPSPIPKRAEFPLPRSQASGNVVLEPTRGSARLVITEFFNYIEQGDYLSATYMLADREGTWWDTNPVPLKELVLAGRFGKLISVKKISGPLTLAGLSAFEADVETTLDGQRLIVKFSLAHLDPMKYLEGVKKMSDKPLTPEEEETILKLAESEEGWVIEGARKA